MKIYRVEHYKSGLGPYSHAYSSYSTCILGFCGQWAENAIRLGESHSVELTHPSPSQDGLFKPLGEVRICGLLLMSRVSEWFDGWGVRLSNNGFYVVEYNCPSSFVDSSVRSSQCIFSLDHAKVVHCSEIWWS